MHAMELRSDSSREIAPRMSGAKIRFVAGTALLGLLVTGCADRHLPPTAAGAAAVAQGSAAQPEPSLDQVYAELAAGPGRTLMLDPAASSVRIYVFRAGRAARLGHNHVLTAPRFKGFIHLQGEDLSLARFDLEFRLDELEFDEPGQRAVLGPAFASVLSAPAIQATREHMLGPSNMQADRFPTVAIHSIGISGEAPRVAAGVDVRMHGQTQRLWVPLAIDGLPADPTVHGSVVLRQTDFGVQPYSVGGGLLAIRDEVVIEFVLKTVASGDAISGR